MKLLDVNTVNAVTVTKLNYTLICFSFATILFNSSQSILGSKAATGGSRGVRSPTGSNNLVINIEFLIKR